MDRKGFVGISGVHSGKIQIIQIIFGTMNMSVPKKFRTSYIVKKNIIIRNTYFEEYYVGVNSY